MLKLSVCVGVAVSVVLTCGVAHATADAELGRQIAQARTESFLGVRPGLGFARSESFTDAWSVVSVYVQGPQSPRGRWVARRVANGSIVPSWTDAAACPELITSLALLERLAPQRIEVLGMSPYTLPRAYLADGTMHTVWSSGGAQPDGAVITVEWSSNSGDLARWGEATEARLAKCWKPEPKR